jgi:hypothetical protein
MAVARVVRRLSSDLSLWTRFGGFPIVAQLLRELARFCPTRAPMLSARAGVVQTNAYYWNRVIEPRRMIARSVI